MIFQSILSCSSSEGRPAMWSRAVEQLQMLPGWNVFHELENFPHNHHGELFLGTKSWSIQQMSQYFTRPSNYRVGLLLSRNSQSANTGNSWTQNLSQHYRSKWGPVGLIWNGISPCNINFLIPRFGRFLLPCMHYRQYKGYFGNPFCDQDRKLPLTIFSQTDQTSFLHNFQQYSHHVYI